MSNSHHPPKICEILFRGFIPDHDQDHFFASMLVVFKSIQTEKGRLKAQVWYWYQFIKSLPSFLSFFMKWSFIMFKNYLKITLRVLRKHKGYSFINISGLAIGMACCILIFLWVRDELSYDRFHHHIDHLYRIATEGHYTSDVNHFSSTPAPLAPALQDEFPEILETCRFASAGRILVTQEDHSFYEEGVLFADTSFYKMFTFPFVLGNIETFRNDPFKVLLSQEMSTKYFGQEDPIGKILQLNHEIDIKVAGVLKNTPEQSEIQFDFLLPFELLIRLGGRTHWGGHSYQTYCLLQNQASFQEINQKLPEWTEAHTVEPVSYYLQPMKQIHLYDLEGGGNITYVYIFSAIAVFIILVACINFMNLATARSGNRSLEVGLRKVVGARKKDIIKQFFSESMILAFIALLFSLLCVYLLLPAFNLISGKNIPFSGFISIKMCVTLLGIALVTGIAAGSYPALFLSSFHPVKVLKGSFKSGARNKWLRRILVIFQFSLSTLLIIGTVILYFQLNFMQKRKLGFQQNHLIYMPIRGNMQQNYNAIKNDLLQQPSILNVTAGSGMPSRGIGGEWGQINWEGKDPEAVIPMNHLAVDDNYLKTFEMEIVQGRDFSRHFTTDTLNFILNESAVKATGLNDPIGKSFTLLFRSGTIIGVVKDFHIRSLRTDIRPLIIRMLPCRFWNYIFIRIQSNLKDMKKVIHHLEEQWKIYAPDYPFVYEFLDQRIDNQYRSERRIGKLLSYFTILSILIACMGLFGLASFMAEQRTKEIGVRKVLGAKTAGIAGLISKEFLIWIVIANTIAWPLAYYIMSGLLQNYAYRIQLGILPFLFAGFISLLMVCLTVSYQALRAARTNPIEALKYE